MKANITKKDVFLYFANKLDRARRREIESACRTDQRVQRWFEELTPTEEEIKQYPLLPKVRIADPAYRDLVAITFLSVEREEQAERARQFVDVVRRAREERKPDIAELWTIVPRELLEDDCGTLLYREAAPPVLACDEKTYSVPPPDVPCIAPDYASGRLVIRQAHDRVPSGIVDVFVVRRRGESAVETFPPVRIALELAEPPQGAPYWYANVPLKTLTRDFHPNDDFVYCVEVVPK